MTNSSYFCPSNLQKKTLIITYCDFPPVINGPAVLMGNLFRHFPKGSYCVLMGDPEKSGRRVDAASKLDCPYFFAPVVHLRRQGIKRVLSLLAESLLILIIAWKGIRIIQREGIECILCVPYESYEIASWIMHKITGKPLFVYLFDMYYAEGRFRDQWHNWVARRFEGIMLRTATKVFVMSEPLQKHYERKFGIAAVLMPHPVDLSLYQVENDPSVHEDGYLKIVFTGVVYDAQLDAIMNLVQVVNSFPEMRAKFTLYTMTPAYMLAKWGISGPNVECRFAPHGAMPAVQKSADILFLPIAFSSPYPDIIRTASPSKMPEYLAAGRPILVHAPAYSYVARYARTKGFGLVVDEPDCDRLKQAILSLSRNNELCRRLISNARQTVHEHEASMVSRRLQTHLGLGDRGRMAGD